MNQVHFVHPQENESDDIVCGASVATETHTFDFDKVTCEVCLKKAHADIRFLLRGHWIVTPTGNVLAKCRSALEAAVVAIALHRNYLYGGTVAEDFLPWDGSEDVPDRSRN